MGKKNVEKCWMQRKDVKSFNFDLYGVIFHHTTPGFLKWIHHTTALRLFTVQSCCISTEQTALLNGLRNDAALMCIKRSMEV